MPETTQVYRGWLTWAPHGEADDILYVCKQRGRVHEDPFAEIIIGDIEQYGHYLSVRYHITDTERSAEELMTATALLAIGIGEAEFQHNYSEITGYLWTDELLQVGGHNLLEELASHLGSFAHIEITYSKTPNSINEVVPNA